MDLTTAEAAQRLNVNQSRVRALIAAGGLEARRFGTQWLVNSDSVEHQAALTTANATGRTMSQRIAWAAADLADGGDAEWLTASERSRLRRRLRGVTRVETVQRWLASRSNHVARYQIGDVDIEDLLHHDDVVSTGVSSVTSYNLGLGTGGTADAYVSRGVAASLISDLFLIESRTGNLTLRIVDNDLHRRTSRHLRGRVVTPRLITGVDLADSRDTRTKATGNALLTAVLGELAE
ncbi:helix-turn-helix domain-containing protein [Flexivirga alba]|uniref:Helix-turn-helix domain-containing protein n=1 Tax=Flexivirga alba TaxID=702742 RepID=A0ABW2AH86_9MICO